MQEQTSTDSRPNFDQPSKPNCYPKTIEKHCPRDGHGSFTANALNIDSDGRVVLFGSEAIYANCPKCAEDSRRKREADEAMRAAQDRQRKVEGILHRSGIPLRFQGRTFQEYRVQTTGQRIALAACKAFAESWDVGSKKGSSLVLTGGPGTGKTHLACAIAEHVAEQFIAAPLFVSASEMLRQIKSTYRKDSERTERQAMNEFVQVPDLLIVDEIGVQFGSDTEKLLMFEVLNDRYQWLMPTILISNLSEPELEDYLGHRVMDRYRECGSVIAFDWPSYRGVAKK